MRTGLLDNGGGGVDVDFLRMVTSLTKVLMRDAVDVSANLAKMCGRQAICAKDTVYALKYVACVFFEQEHLEQRVLVELDEEHQHTYETDDEESDEEGEGEADEAFALTQEAVSYDFISGDRALYDNIMQTSASWTNWNPEDPVKRLLKNAINNTAAACLPPTL